MYIYVSFKLVRICVCVKNRKEKLEEHTPSTGYCSPLSKDSGIVNNFLFTSSLLICIIYNKGNLIL